MSDEAPGETKDFNSQIIEEFRANDGVVGGPFEGAPLVLLTTTGARSGQRRTTPLMSYTEDGRLFVVASKAGAPDNPDWYHNVKANPTVTVEQGTETFEARAEEVAEPERTELYGRIAELMPTFGEYQRQTERTIPMVELHRT